MARLGGTMNSPCWRDSFDLSLSVDKAPAISLGHSATEVKLTMSVAAESESRETMDYSVVVPVYRGADTLEPLCARLASFFESLGSHFEIILVDDASKDGSWDVIRNLAAEESRVRGIRLMRNFGQHNATNCGLDAAQGEFIVTIDEDLQFLPEDIEKLIACQRREDADVVYGTPMVRQQKWWRIVGSYVARRIMRFAMGVTVDVSSFRLVRRSVAEVVATATRHDIMIDVYLSWTTTRMNAVPVTHCESRPSGYTVLRLAMFMLDVICNYTVAPLRAATAVGALLSLASFLLAAYFSWNRIVHGTVVPGFTAVIVAILLSTGLILFFLGVAAEYIGRIFQYVNRKPQWIIRDTTADVG